VAEQPSGGVGNGTSEAEASEKAFPPDAEREGGAGPVAGPETDKQEE